MPSCLTSGRTSLLQKDKSKGNVASNYRSITCLPLMWKLLTGVIADQIYAHLDQEKQQIGKCFIKKVWQIGMVFALILVQMMP